jgi:hypothetical protein
MPSRSATAPTGSGSRNRRSMIWRRLGSARALKVSITPESIPQRDYSSQGIYNENGGASPLFDCENPPQIQMREFADSRRRSCATSTPLRWLDRTVLGSDFRSRPLPSGSLPAVRGQTTTGGPRLLSAHVRRRVLRRRDSCAPVPVPPLQAHSFSAGQPSKWNRRSPNRNRWAAIQPTTCNMRRARVTKLGAASGPVNADSEAYKPAALFSGSGVSRTGRAGRAWLSARLPERPPQG